MPGLNALAQQVVPLLCAGSTYVPQVQRFITGLAGVPPRSSVHPEECVAIGAAVQVSMLSTVMLVKHSNTTFALCCRLLSCRACTHSFP